MNKPEEEKKSIEETKPVEGPTEKEIPFIIKNETITHKPNVEDKPLQQNFKILEHRWNPITKKVEPYYGVASKPDDGSRNYKK